MSALIRPILIVDDDPDEATLTTRALAKAGIKNPIVAVPSGEHAIAYLKERLTAPETSLPLFILLDLNMPGADGFHVLNWIRAQPPLRKLLTVVLSSSTEERDVAKAYALGAKTYLGKYPVASDLSSIFQLANAMLTIEEVERLVLPGIKRPVTP